MARTIQVIFNEIVASKEADNALHAKLTSNSATAVWRMWAYITAIAIHTLEILFDQFKAEVSDIVEKGITGNGQWYRDQALKFQLNDTLQVVNYRVFYDPIVPENQIVKRASVKQSGRLVTLKVAKEVDGVLTPLNAIELAQFDSYMNDVRFAGTQLVVSSLNADALLANIEIVYNGIFDPTVIEANVITAISEYLANITFDGFVLVQKIEEAILSVEGVSDVKILSLSGISGAVNTVFFDLSLGINNRQYETRAGYIVYSNSSVITLIPQ